MSLGARASQVDPARGAPEHPPPWERPGAVAGAFSRGIARAPHVRALLGARALRPLSGASDAAGLDYVVGWGEKPNTRRAQQFARRHGLPYLRLEDGFLRSVGLGVRGADALSVVLDATGIYYDATRPSRLERLLSGEDAQSEALEDPALLSRARACIDAIVRERLSKYNDSPSELPALPGAGATERVLVADQTAGDMSVQLGELGDGAFGRMLRAALDEHPGAQVLVKVHPDVLAGKKRGCLGPLPAEPRVHALSEPVNPIALLEQVSHVYVATSQLGFEALLTGKPVSCFGVPFYAGWGLTDDRVAAPRRGRARSLEQVFAAAYLLYARYVDPDGGERCEIERVIEHLALQRRTFADNAGRLLCFGFSGWKRNYVREYLRSPGNDIMFCRDAAAAERKGLGASARIVVWGRREGDAVRQLARRYDLPIWRMEDGFLRSVGLGSDFTAPASLVVDRVGVYYDPSAPSELEQILQRADFAPHELERASRLRQTIVERGVSKYNLGGAGEVARDRRPGQRVVLVPGQVEDDASIQLGCRDVRTNERLLRQVREREPGAYILFKPHPDVVSGNRQGAVADASARASADEVIGDSSIAACLDAADEVHTMTSLVGFEALMRGKRVVCYGQPFYAGWGLTEDVYPVERRQRARTLDELVAATLLRYPRYLNPETGWFTTPEVIVAQLHRARGAGAATRMRRSWLSRRLHKLVHLYKGMTHVR